MKHLPPDHPPPLFSPLARAGDPTTSHAAAAQIVPALAGLWESTVALVRKFPGRTCSELEREAQCLGRTIGRRLSECEAHGWIKRGPARACLVTGRMAHTWSPVEEQTSPAPQLTARDLRSPRPSPGAAGFTVNHRPRDGAAGAPRGRSSP